MMTLVSKFYFENKGSSKAPGLISWFRRTRVLPKSACFWLVFWKLEDAYVTVSNTVVIIQFQTVGAEAN
jgi:hypothetical protein